MTQSTSESAKRWVGIGLLLLGWFVAGAWWTSSYATRLSVAEKAIEQKASQQQLDLLQKQMDRIETKLDKALERK